MNLIIFNYGGVSVKQGENFVTGVNDQEKTTRTAQTIREI